MDLRKINNRLWKFVDEEIGEFSPSKFTINRLNNEITVVYFNNLQSKTYNVSDVYIYDVPPATAFNTSNGDELMAKLEELNCPCFQKDETTIIGGDSSWGSITGTLSDQTDLQSVLNAKQDLLNAINLGQIIYNELAIKSTPSAADEIVMYDSLTGEAVTAKFSSFNNVKTESVTIANRWTLTNANVYYRAAGAFCGFNAEILNASTAATSITSAVASSSSAFYCTKVSKALSKIYIDGSNVTSTLTDFKLGVFAFQRANAVAPTAINIITIGEFTLTKASGDGSHFWELTPTNLEIPAGYLVSCVLMRTGGTGTEINCSMTFKFDDYVA